MRSHLIAVLTIISRTDIVLWHLTIIIEHQRSAVASDWPTASLSPMAAHRTNSMKCLANWERERERGMAAVTARIKSRFAVSLECENISHGPCRARPCQATESSQRCFALGVFAVHFARGFVSIEWNFRAYALAIRISLGFFRSLSLTQSRMNLTSADFQTGQKSEPIYFRHVCERVLGRSSIYHRLFPSVCIPQLRVRTQFVAEYHFHLSSSVLLYRTRRCILIKRERIELRIAYGQRTLVSETIANTVSGQKLLVQKWKSDSLTSWINAGRNRFRQLHGIEMYSWLLCISHNQQTDRRRAGKINQISFTLWLDGPQRTNKLHALSIVHVSNVR